MSAATDLRRPIGLASFPPDYEARTIAFAHTCVDDIPECYAADFKVRFVGLIPLLIIAFHLPQTLDQPAIGIRLVTVSRSRPLEDGQLLSGDRLKRHIRTRVDEYLHKHGIRIPDFAPELN